MQRDSDGRWTIDVDLGPGCAYQFRYLRDGVAWMNDRQADAYVPNPYGSDNSVIIADPGFEPYYDGKDQYPGRREERANDGQRPTIQRRDLRRIRRSHTA
jgi:hypothetical protein